MDDTSVLHTVEEETMRVLSETIAGRMPVRSLDPLPTHARRSVVGEPTALLRIYGRDRPCVVRVFVQVVIVEDAETDPVLPGHLGER